VYGVEGTGCVRDGAGVFVAAEGALRFRGETKGLWMPRGSTRRRFGAGGVDMVGLRFTSVLLCVFGVVEVEAWWEPGWKVWRGNDEVGHPALE
jgi:hypothetical protein